MQDGIDRVELLISPNKDHEPRPLRRIASGGDRSLAARLKRVIGECGPAWFYGFDEVDSGVGGAVADEIDRAIAHVARHQQVFCATYLAPIVAVADAHCVLFKENVGGIAKSSVARVDEEDRIAEAARRLSGAKVTGASLHAATELVEAARR
jgi:DNA repair protein RecN (Recombination protein N)